MINALIADGEKLSLLTGQDHGPHFISVKEEDEEDFLLPQYDKPGRILFRLYRDEDGSYGAEVYSHDEDSAVFWIVEGGFPDYWILDWINIELTEADGWFVVEGITGSAGVDWFTGEGWEEFYPGDVRRATDEEIRTETLS